MSRSGKRGGKRGGREGIIKNGGGREGKRGGREGNHSGGGGEGEGEADFANQVVIHGGGDDEIGLYKQIEILLDDIDRIRDCRDSRSYSTPVLLSAHIHLQLHLRALGRLNPPFQSKAQFLRLCNSVGHEFVLKNINQRSRTIKEAYQAEIDNWPELTEKAKIDKLAIVSYIQENVFDKDVSNMPDSPWPTEKEIEEEAEKKRKQLEDELIKGEEEEKKTEKKKKKYEKQRARKQQKKEDQKKVEDRQYAEIWSDIISLFSQLNNKDAGATAWILEVHLEALQHLKHPFLCQPMFVQIFPEFEDQVVRSHSIKEAYLTQLHMFRDALSQINEFSEDYGTEHAMIVSTYQTALSHFDYMFELEQEEEEEVKEKEEDKKSTGDHLEIGQVISCGNINITIIGNFEAAFPLSLTGGDYVKKCRIEVVAPNQLVTYVTNLGKMAGDDRIIQIYHSLHFEKKNFLLVEHYGSNLSELATKDSAKKVFWEKDDILSTRHKDWMISQGFISLWRPSIYFQKLLRDIVSTMCSLYENSGSFKLSWEKVVFLTTDVDHVKPKFRQVFDEDDFPKVEEDVNEPWISPDPLKAFFANLNDVITRVMTAHNLTKREMYNDAVRYIDRLESLKEEESVQRLLRHSFMWRRPMKLMFYCRWYKMKKDKTLQVSLKSKKIEEDFKDKGISAEPEWYKVADSNHLLHLKMIFAKERNKLDYKKEALSHPLATLLKFIRNMNQHLQDDMFNEPDGHDFESEGIIPMSEIEFDAFLDFLCPKLVDFLIDLTPSDLYNSTVWYPDYMQS